MGIWTPSVGAFEVPGTRVESQRRQNSSASVSVHVAWDCRYEFLRDIRQLTPDTPFLGQPWPFNKDLTFPVFFDSGSISNRQFTNEKVVNINKESYDNYEKAVIDLNYIADEATSGGNPVGIGTDPNTGDEVTVVDTLESSFSHQQINIKELYWVDPDEEFTPDDPEELEHVEEEFSATHLIKQFVFVRTISGLTRVNSEMLELAGSVNDEEFATPLLGAVVIFPPETLLFGSPQLSYDFATRKYNLTLRFPFQNNGTLKDPKGWNHFFRFNATTAKERYSRMGIIPDAPDPVTGDVTVVALQFHLLKSFKNFLFEVTLDDDFTPITL